MRVVESKNIYIDGRGKIQSFDLKAWKEANYVATKKGTTRGNHYHMKTREKFLVMEGSIEVLIENVMSGRRQKRRFSEGNVFEIKPYEYHVIKAVTDCKWISFLSIKYNKNKPDVW
ncbi:MAG: hypothetical protein HYX24_03120 [Candidatus Aenigmarchaeota archaeon]|nr:hypothetical protein [Candidatus Aenigmarchaeota archaeon]